MDTNIQPEHEQHLLNHVKEMGFMFIVDLFKKKFPDLSHDEACTIYRKFKAKHAADPETKKANEQIKRVGNEIGKQIKKIILDQE